MLIRSATDPTTNLVHSLRCTRNFSMRVRTSRLSRPRLHLYLRSRLDIRASDQGSSDENSVHMGHTVVEAHMIMTAG